MTKPLPKTDPTGYFTFAKILEEARDRGYGARAFAIAAGVYQRRTGEPCPFTEQVAPAPKPAPAPAPTPVPAAGPAMVVDFETRSRCDLKEHGASVYAEHPSTEVLCLAYMDGGEPRLWEPSQGRECPAAIVAHLAAGGLLEAHNAEFEQAIWHYVCHLRMGWPAVPPDRWRDSMARCAAWALPLSLGPSTAALGLPQQKDDKGKQVMLRLCRPRRPSKNDQREWFDDPADFAVLYDYCRQDVRAEHALTEHLPDLAPAELQVWLAHNRMNRRGIHIDRPGIQAALRMLGLEARRIDARIREATGGQLTADDLARRDHVLTWCRSRGVSLARFAKADVADALGDDLPADVRIVLEARQSLGRTSTAKFQAMLDRANSDDRIRGSLVYHGAATGRWVGRGVQPQNLPRESVPDVATTLADMATLDAEAFAAKHGDAFKAAVGCLRGCLSAGPGNVLVAADYAQIESRVLFWLAGEGSAIRAFVDYDAGRGPDVYRVMASAIYSKPADDVTKDERQVGKAAILGLGFGMGPAKFYTTCQAQGVKLESHLVENVVATYRSRYPRVKALWYQTEDAAVQAVNDGPSAPPKENGRCRWRMIGPHLFCRLPSGRRLCYPFAELRPTVTPWGEERQQVTFMGENALTRQWERMDTYGGKLVENVVQAVARDFLAAALVKADAGGWSPVFMCHDELVCEVPAARAAETVVDELEALMCDVPAWATGCPVAAEGWCDKRYRK